MRDTGISSATFFFTLRARVCIYVRPWKRARVREHSVSIIPADRTPYKSAAGLYLPGRVLPLSRLNLSALTAAKLPLRFLYTYTRARTQMVFRLAEYSDPHACMENLSLAHSRGNCCIYSVYMCGCCAPPAGALNFHAANYFPTPARLRVRRSI